MAFAFGYPLGTYIAEVASDQVSGNLISCVTKDKWVLIALQIIPIDICMVIAAIILIPSAYLVVKTKTQLARKHSTRKRWISTVRVLVFITYYLLALIWGTATAIWNTNNEDEITDGITNWVLCSISLQDNCRDEHLYRMPYAFFLFQGIYFALSGLVIFGCFGTSDEAIRWWKRAIHGEVELTAVSSKTISMNSMNSSSRQTSTSHSSDSPPSVPR